MSNFELSRKRKEEREKKDELRREKLASYFFNLSQLTFAALVLGGFPQLFNSGTRKIDWDVILFGIASTSILAAIAFQILKNK